MLAPLCRTDMPLTVKELNKKLKKLIKSGYADFLVMYLYEESGEPVRDHILFVEVADSADGDEIHMYQ